MTANDFRKIALAFPETEERSHMDHPDFRVAGKIFATLGYPDTSLGMVKLSPEDQHNFTKDHSKIFVPGGRSLGTPRCHFRSSGTGGKRNLQSHQAAWRNTAPKRLQELIQRPCP